MKPPASVEVMCPTCRMPIIVPIVVGPLESDGTVATVNISADERAIKDHICRPEGVWRVWNKPGVAQEDS